VTKSNWMDAEINFSQVLLGAVKEKLNIG
jgi:hypothetical protein